MRSASRVAWRVPGGASTVIWGGSSGGWSVRVRGAAGAGGLERLGEVVVVGAHRADDAQHVSRTGSRWPPARRLPSLSSSPVGEQGRHDDGGGVGVAVAAQRPAHGLHDVGDRFLRGAEQHRVDRRDVDALAQAAGVGHHRPAAGRAGCAAASSARSRCRLLIRPWTYPADSGPAGRRPGGSIASVAGKLTGELAGLGDAGQERHAAAQPELRRRPSRARPGRRPSGPARPRPRPARCCRRAARRPGGW